ncbi:MAG: succinylglutamate desuccinylase/aspartoacylase family protein [Prosthecobacter sp.]|uniref:succinylglutamate desuccinylase/aspartoacylase domain-containing protein n=1 Tax=Prosthecobacter sp. TaxID=1965333 RepID=UPI0025E5F624|nr:succinylglutamate desuccinylase/aspartoacylase family protein [Prosthecobacter sp.]MCF7786829.1 succinylglutamate desuccinylase/aspartoacylase family protein [Prosthecobacter sp.]
MIPITIVARGKGPTVLVLGGNHGDEYQGQIAIMKLARELTSEKVSPRPRATSRASPTRHPKSNFPADQSGCQSVGSTRFENCVMGFRLRR